MSNVAEKSDRLERARSTAVSNRTVFMVQPGASGKAYRALLDFIAQHAELGAMPLTAASETVDRIERVLGAGMVGHRKCGRWPLMDGTWPHQDLLVFRWPAALPLLIERRRPIPRDIDDPIFEVFAFDATQTLLYGTFREHLWAWLSLTPRQAEAMPDMVRAIVRSPRGYELGIEPVITSPEVDEIAEMSERWIAMPNS